MRWWRGCGRVRRRTRRRPAESRSRTSVDIFRRGVSYRRSIGGNAMWTRTFLAAFLLLAAPITRASPDPSTLTPPPEASQFDFLIGTWDIVSEPNVPGVPPKVYGRWTAQKSADGFMVVDEYRISDGSGGTAYLGETYRVYNPKAKRWDYRFVEPYSGTWHEGTAVKDGAEMHLTQGTSTSAGGGMT